MDDVIFGVKIFIGVIAAGYILYKISMFFYKLAASTLNIIRSIFSPAAVLQNNIIEQNKERRIERNEKGIREKKKAKIRSMFSSCELAIKVQSTQKNQITLRDEVVHDTIYPKLRELVVNGEKCIEIEFPMDFKNPEPTLRKFLPKISEDINSINREFDLNPNEYINANYNRVFVNNDKRTFRIFESVKRQTYTINTLPGVNKNELMPHKLVVNLVDSNSSLETIQTINLALAPIILFLGKSRSGKTKTFLSFMYRFLIDYPDTIIRASDCKNGSDLNPLAAQYSSFPVAKIRHKTENPAIEVINNLIATYNDYLCRQKICDEYGASTIYELPAKGYKQLPRILFCLDEMAQLQASLDKKSADIINNMLISLACAGGSYGITTIFLSQEARADTFDPKLKSNCSLMFIHSCTQADWDYLKLPGNAPKLLQGEYALLSDQIRDDDMPYVIGKQPYIGSEFPYIKADMPKLSWNEFLQTEMDEDNLISVRNAIVSSFLRDNKVIKFTDPNITPFCLETNDYLIAIGDIEQIQNFKILDINCKKFSNTDKKRIWLQAYRPSKVKNKAEIIENLSTINCRYFNYDEYSMLLRNSFQSSLINNEPTYSLEQLIEQFEEIESMDTGSDLENLASSTIDSSFELSLKYYDHLVKMKDTAKKGDNFELLFEKLAKELGYSSIVTSSLFKIHPNRRTPSAKRHDNGSDWGIDLILYKGETDFKEAGSLDAEKLIFVQSKCFKDPGFLKPNIINELAGAVGNYAWMLNDPSKLHLAQKAIWTPAVTNEQSILAIQNLNIIKLDRGYFIKTLDELKKTQKASNEEIVYDSNPETSSPIKNTEDLNLSIRALKSKYQIGTSKAMKYKELLSISIEKAKIYLEDK